LNKDLPHQKCSPPRAGLR